MDPSLCHNPTFVFSFDEEEPITIIEEENLETRLVNAARVAEGLLESSSPLLPALEIDNETGCSIVVHETIDENGVSYLSIHLDASVRKSPFLKIPHDKFQYIYFRNLRDCRIFIKCKMLKLMFQRCNGCQISLREPVISMVEFFQCIQTNVVIRVPCDPEQTAPPIPLIRIEECPQTHVYQSNDVLYYVIKASPSVTGTIVNGDTGERTAKYSVGTTGWAHPSEQNLVCLSRAEGFASVPMKYALNDISHHVHVQSPDESEVMDTEEVFLIGTPPV